MGDKPWSGGFAPTRISNSVHPEGLGPNGTGLLPKFRFCGTARATCITADIMPANATSLMVKILA
jgi:hypothetical protein